MNKNNDKITNIYVKKPIQNAIVKIFNKDIKLHKRDFKKIKLKLTYPQFVYYVDSVVKS